jgi:hypothetical protein
MHTDSPTPTVPPPPGTNGAAAPFTPPPPAWQTAPAGWYPQARPDAPSGFKRPVTLSGMLTALLLTVALFASVVAALVLTDSFPRGAEGAQGTQGQIGPQGVAGPRGRSGKSGLNGLDGATGTPGATGAPGTPGRACSNDVTVPLPYC